MTNFILKKNIFIRSKSDHYIALSVPNLTDVTLVCKNANWKLVNVDEERINDSLVEKLKFGQDIKAEFFVTFFSWSLVQTWSTGFSQDFEIEIWPIFWGWCLLEIWQFWEIQLGTKIEVRLYPAPDFTLFSREKRVKYG